VENEVMNALGYDAVTLGNHEFDNGLEALGERLASLNAPVVVCNYDFSPFEAGKYIKPYVVVEKAGMKIGIIGATCNLKDVVSAEIVNRLPEFDFVETVQKYVDELRPTCDLIVLLTHLGYTPHLPGNTTDPIMAAATRGVDIIVGGHSHTFMDAADMVPNLDGVPVPVVQAGEWGVNMGEFHVTK
jgi:5'-nucleotidase